MSIEIKEVFKNLIPPLTDEEFAQLENNIIKEGCRDSLVVWNNILIDGHNRYEICTKHNIPFTTVAKHFNSQDEAEEWIIKNQFGRRNLTLFQRSELALRLKPIIQAKAKERQLATLKQNATDVQKSAPREKTKARDELAKIAGVSHDTIEKVEVIKKQGTEEQIQRARQGGKGNSVNAIFKEIKNRDYLVKDFKGDVVGDIRSLGENIMSDIENVVNEIYDTEKEITLTSEDLVLDLQSVASRFISNGNRIYDEYKVSITDSDKQKIKDCLLEVESVINKLRGELL